MRLPGFTAEASFAQVGPAQFVRMPHMRLRDFNVIGYAEAYYGKAFPAPIARYPGVPDDWTCPWVFIPGGACGYYYCPVERHPVTGQPIRQLIPAECDDEMAPEWV